MTKAQAERITGMQVVVHEFPRCFICQIFYSVGRAIQKIVTSPECKTAAEAIEKAVHANYRRVSDEVFLAQGRRCFKCGRVRALQCDHIKGRGRGDRLDQFEVLRGMCAECHEYRHKNPRVLIEPCRAVEEKMELSGWSWSHWDQRWKRAEE